MIPVCYSVRNLGQRITTSAMTAMSVALVVMVLTILLGFVNGMRRAVTLAAVIPFTSGCWKYTHRYALPT